MNFTSLDTMGKIIAMYIPIFTFFALGMEHSIVNAWIIPAGIFMGAKANFLDWVLWNVFPVFVGNFVGGSCLTGIFLFALHFEPQKENGNRDVEVALVEVKVHVEENSEEKQGADEINSFEKNKSQLLTYF